MGRYYSGDIDGKFWFGVQSSSAADRFGVEGVVPDYLEYKFLSDDLEAVEKELKEIEDSLGDYLELLKTFFDKNAMYSDEDLANYLKLEKNQLQWYLSEYADYHLGIQIRDCIKENGNCFFKAEL